ncbi:hypothetical protein ACWOB6_04555 [Falseniella ignava]
MVRDNYIIGRLYLPIAMIILLGVMIYFHRHNRLKYLYISTIFLYLIAIVTYFFLQSCPVGAGYESPWITAVKFVWLISIFAAYVLSIASIDAFVIEHARRHLWAKVIIGIVGLAFIAGCLIVIYYFIQLVKIIGIF